MLKCPECEVILMQLEEDVWECPICAYKFENDLELKTGVTYMRSTCSIGIGHGNFPNDLHE